MNLATDPPTREKIAAMARRVRWGDPRLRDRGIDQTRLVVEGSPGEPLPFSFLVIGDSGTGHHRGDHPQRRVAERLLAEGGDAAFLLHTGDVVYLVGSSEYYPGNFIRPYREWLEGGENWRAIHWREMVFRRPFLPVPGNHDYYDLAPALALLSGLTLPLRRLLRSQIDWDVAWHGSFRGEAYAQAFLDLLERVPEPALERHLQEHYPARESGGRCLSYRPGRFTRLPNRYYAFRHAGVEFLALDSNTFNEPLPRGEAPADRPSPLQLREELQRLERRRQRLLLEALQPPFEGEDGAGHHLERIEQLEEEIRDLQRQLATPADPCVDQEQLDWLRERLIASWQDPSCRGRVLVLHHAPYTTEATKWDQAQTLAVRIRLRRVLAAVRRAMAGRIGERSTVDLVLAGHAHCLEVLRSRSTHPGDGGVPWVVCGGSGYSLRRQRRNGPVLQEAGAPVADSLVFQGRSGHGRTLRRPYSAVRIDVDGGEPLRLSATGLLAVKAKGGWHEECVPLPLAMG